LTIWDKCRRSQGSARRADFEAQQVDLTSVTGQGGGHDSGFELVHADLLRFFPDLVRELGGDPEALLRRLGVDGALLASAGSGLSCRIWVNLLEHAAVELHCPDFGMRLARRQGGGRVFGAMGAVMRNTKTFGEALTFVAEHGHAHSPAVRLRLERDPESGHLVSAYDFLLDRLPNRCQAIEQVHLLGHLNALESTGGRARVREVRVRHQPLSPLSTYGRYFGCEVRFDQQDDAVVYSERDLSAPIVDADARAYETAASFIDAAFPRVSPPMHAQVRGVILQFLGTEYCNIEEVAAELGLHLRTLRRRLNAEGKGFQEIKDEVRREVALYYLLRTDLDLACVAQKLGYAEHSAFTRRSLRWFSAPPSRVRSQSSHASSPDNLEVKDRRAVAED
jgi:AraC-like DNA-binding protein